WRTEHDVPLAHYSAFMHAEHGTRPYLQLFEISFPGTIIVHLALTRVFGYGDGGLMVANLLWFLALGGVTWLLMAPFGRLVAAGSVALFGVAYFSHGPAMMLQRDPILTLFVAAALLLHVRAWLSPSLRRLLVGALLGVAAAIKPHAGLALLPLAVGELLSLRQAQAGGPAAAARTLGAYLAGFAVPCLLVAAWLVASGGFGAWLEMSRQYMPLYLRMTGYHMTIEGSDRLRHLIKGVRLFGGQITWFVAAGAGSFLVLSDAPPSSPRARLTRLLLAEAGVFAIYPVFAGQFWDYHYIPFLYFLTLLSALCLVPVVAARGRVQALLPKMALVLALVANQPLTESVKLFLLSQPSVKSGQVDEMAAFLRARLRPGDTVQPLDWTGGAVHAMLIARARLATRFMYDFHFYHHVSHPFIQLLRRRFLDEFQRAQPRFVLEYFGENKPWPSGKDTTREFPELQQILATSYRVQQSGLEYRIHERRE
ncbi:MAG: hypothetical protein QOI66_4442, partial [Myxococcales bacterium]|nr:hypothetical protein [Myxococcales bacterium]